MGATTRPNRSRRKTRKCSRRSCRCSCAPRTRRRGRSRSTRSGGSVSRPSTGRPTTVYSKGASDGWCSGANRLPAQLQGAFWVNEGIRLARVSDGTSNTFCMGEGAGGDRWPLCRGPGCTTVFEGPWGRQPATGIWAINGVGSAPFSAMGVLVAGLWDCTTEQMNKIPVTDSWFDHADMGSCRSSAEGSLDSTANFRSDHAGGVHSLFIDGGVRFASQTIASETYKSLSTIAGGEVATAP